MISLSRARTRKAIFAVADDVKIEGDCLECKREKATNPKSDPSIEEARKTRDELNRKVTLAIHQAHDINRGLRSERPRN